MTVQDKACRLPKAPPRRRTHESVTRTHESVTHLIVRFFIACDRSASCACPSSGNHFLSFARLFLHPSQCSSKRQPAYRRCYAKQPTNMFGTSCFPQRGSRSESQPDYQISTGQPAARCLRSPVLFHVKRPPPFAPQGNGPICGATPPHGLHSGDNSHFPSWTRGEYAPAKPCTYEPVPQLASEHSVRTCHKVQLGLEADTNLATCRGSAINCGPAVRRQSFSDPRHPFKISSTIVPGVRGGPSSFTDALPLIPCKNYHRGCGFPTA